MKVSLAGWCHMQRFIFSSSLSWPTLVCLNMVKYMHLVSVYLQTPHFKASLQT